MFKQNCWTMLLLLIWLLTTHLDLGVGQSQNAIGAHRAYDKTSFSCTGRPAGYYADIETGCQVYHMCDGLGRQFSYSCPNTTLFQQRMLICDHWYMVNCSKAESDYAANLLIGQRDKPFVNDEESNLRTPRPDLLDRPYAPDYSGESFRKQYNKPASSVQNQIIDNNEHKTTDKLASASQLQPGQTRWKIPPPSRTILPPAYEPQVEQTTTPKSRSTNNVRFITTTKAKQTTQKPFAHTPTSSSRRPTASPFSATPKPTRRQNYPNSNKAALHQRQQHDILAAEHDDLGTSHSTRYNTSADFNSAEARVPNKPGSAQNRKSSYTTTISNSVNKSSIKVPSKIYEPPFLYPIYNQEEEPASTAQPLRASSAAPFMVATRTTTSPTTIRPNTRPTTLAGKPFTPSPLAALTSTTPQIFRNSNTLNHNQPLHGRFGSNKLDTRTPTPAQGFKPPTPRPPINSAKTLRPPTTTKTQRPVSSDNSSNSVAKSTTAAKTQLPANDLLPPFQEFVQHDVATTQGPPIYYDWKIPSNGLEPPKLDPPIGVDGREYSDIAVDYNSISTAGGFTPSTTFGVDQAKTTESTKNPFLVSKQKLETSTAKTSISRSVKETAQPNGVQKFTRSDAVVSTVSSNSADLTQIRKEFSVPEYLFPLEDIGRTGYLSSDTYNSFQLKIPDGQNLNGEEHLHWFGENPKCPECHPSYVKPGTCEPCLRR